MFHVSEGSIDRPSLYRVATWRQESEIESNTISGLRSMKLTMMKALRVGGRSGESRCSILSSRISGESAVGYDGA